MWDAENMFSVAQTLAGADSTNVVDVGIGDAGKSAGVFLNVLVSPGSAGTLTVTVKTSDAADMSGAVEVAKYTVSADKLERGGDVLTADLPTGCKRYLRLTYAGGSGGTVTAGLNWGGQTNGM